MTVLKVTEERVGLRIRFSANHPKVKQIQEWLDNGLSPGYVEYLLKAGRDPHCSACRDWECENVGNGDDACRGFKYGERW